MYFIATIEDKANIDQVVENLEQYGYIVDRVRHLSRNISCRSSKHSLDELRKVKGIKFAEEKKDIFKA